MIKQNNYVKLRVKDLTANCQAIYPVLISITFNHRIKKNKIQRFLLPSSFQKK